MAMVSLLIFSCSKENRVELEKQNLNTEVETRSACPEGPGGGCLAIGQSFSGTFTYQGCAIPFTATYYVCPQGIQMDPVVWDYNNLPNTTGCNMLKKKLSDLFALGDEAGIMNILDGITIGMTNQAQATIFTIVQTLNPGIYQCSNIPAPCENQQYQYTFSTRTVTCNKLCATFKGDGEGGGQWDLYLLVCGQSCCSRSSYFCMNPNGTICYGPIVYSQISQCSSNGPCPSGMFGSGICRTKSCTF
jgi:hypothetical protein